MKAQYLLIAALLVGLMVPALVFADEEKAPVSMEEKVSLDVTPEMIPSQIEITPEITPVAEIPAITEAVPQAKDDPTPQPIDPIPNPESKPQWNRLLDAFHDLQRQFEKMTAHVETYDGQMKAMDNHVNTMEQDNQSEFDFIHYLINRIVYWVQEDKEAIAQLRIDTQQVQHDVVKLQERSTHNVYMCHYLDDAEGANNGWNPNGHHRFFEINDNRVTPESVVAVTVDGAHTNCYVKDLDTTGETYGFDIGCSEDIPNGAVLNCTITNPYHEVEE